MSTVAAISDIALLERFSHQRDETAFAELVRRYAGMVYAACFRVLHDKQLAEDAVQETFLRLLRRPESVQVSVGGWLHKTATQHAIDVCRSESTRRKRERAHAEKEVELLGEQSSWKEISNTVDEALLELPEEDRDLLVQHFILSRPQKEIAQERNASVATVCRRVNDALERLRAVLQRRNISVSAIALVGDFLATHGTDAVSPTLQQALGKMTMVAGVRRTWRMARQQGDGQSGARQIELAIGMAVAAIILTVIIILLLGHRGKPAEPSGEPHPSTGAGASAIVTKASAA
jgi:RNA polymerase sigma factor (sigma-70 family)